MRITTELRKRSKNFGSMVMRIYITPPKACEEVRILGRQVVRFGTSVAAHTREGSRARCDSKFCSKLDPLPKKQTSASDGLNIVEKIVIWTAQNFKPRTKMPTS